MNKNPYTRHRFSKEIISHCVWLYNSFSLSLRDIEKMMLYRGIELTYESIRDWVNSRAPLRDKGSPLGPFGDAGSQSRVARQIESTRS